MEDGPGDADDSACSANWVEPRKQTEPDEREARHEHGGAHLANVRDQVHHAAAGGFHTARLVDDIQALTAEPGWVG